MSAPEFSIHLHEQTDLRGALVIVGAPGLGLVGSIATQYMVRHLEMPLIGGVYSTRFPPTVQVAGGRPLPPIRIYAKHARGRFGLDSDRLVVIHTELELDETWLQDLAHAVVAWAKDAKCQTLAVVDGILVQESENDDIILGVATREEGAKALDQQKVLGLPAGTVGGLAGALLQAGSRTQLNVVALLAEAKPGYPDAAAAARLVEILDRMVPGIQIGTEPLLREAQRIEVAVRELQDKMSAESSQRAEPDAAYR